jgi:hypothetical protein
MTPVSIQNPAAAPNLDGLTAGHVVHYVLENGEHRPAIVVEVPGLVAARVQDGITVTEPAPPDSGIIGCTVFLSPHDGWIGEPTRYPLTYSPGVHHDPTGTEPHTWHWIECAPQAPKFNVGDRVRVMAGDHRGRSGNIKEGYDPRYLGNATYLVRLTSPFFDEDDLLVRLPEVWLEASEQASGNEADDGDA